MSMEKCPVCGNLVFTDDSRAKSDAFEALADIRKWACETLNASDAGKLCGMPSDVSRYANGLEAENEQLRELVRDLRACNGSCTRCIELMGKCEYEGRMSELGIEVE